MGNCCSCFKVPPSPTANVTGTPLEKDREEIMELCGILSQSQELHRLTANVEPQSNGNSKTFTVLGSDYCGSLKRTFYPRIPRTVMAAEVKPREPSENKLNTLFENYRDTHEDCILAEGIERLCADLQVSPDEYRVLLLAWKLKAEQMCRFTRAEFIGGCRDLRVDSLRALQARLPDLEAEVARDADSFKDLYRFTFRFGLDVEAGQRILPSDMAVCLWRLVFTSKPPAVLPRWLFFLETHPHVRGIPKDTWNMFLNFTEAVGCDLSCYDDTEAWPSLFDDFVEFENDQTNQNISKGSRDSNVIKQDYE